MGSSIVEPAAGAATPPSPSGFSASPAAITQTRSSSSRGERREGGSLARKELYVPKLVLMLARREIRAVPDQGQKGGETSGPAPRAQRVLAAVRNGRQAERSGLGTRVTWEGLADERVGRAEGLTESLWTYLVDNARRSWRDPTLQLGVTLVRQLGVSDHERRDSGRDEARISQLALPSNRVWEDGGDITGSTQGNLVIEARCKVR
jgi:hypothetical protein